MIIQNIKTGKKTNISKEKFEGMPKKFQDIFTIVKEDESQVGKVIEPTETINDDSQEENENEHKPKKHKKKNES